jgi:2-pyrone-4,6-dicarboxylate lactonase
LNLTAPPDPHPRPPKFQPPAGACDTHFHLFGPASRYPFHPESRYLSADALPGTYFELQQILGLSRGVLVSGGGYGTDYTHLEHTLARFPGRLRGILLPPQDLTVQEIRRLDALGVRGMRFISPRRFSKLPALDERLAQRAFEAAGWQVHFYAGGDLEAHLTRLRALPNTVVLDHFGGLDADRPQGEIDALLELLDSAKVWIKLSGPMRLHDGRLSLPRRDAYRAKGGAARPGPAGLGFGLAAREHEQPRHAERRRSAGPSRRMGAGRGRPRPHPGGQPGGFVRLLAAQSRSGRNALLPRTPGLNRLTARGLDDLVQFLGRNLLHLCSTADANPAGG